MIAIGNKIEKTPYTAFYPLPVALVTSVGNDLKPNIITIAWTGTVNSVPPMVYISVRPNRHSYQLIKESGEYIINVPTAKIVKEVDFCGLYSGRDLDKFAATGLTPVPASTVKPPLIKECPLNMECRVKQVIELGSHHMFLAEVTSVKISDEYLTPKGQLDIDLAKAVSYCAREYWSVEQKIDKHGFSRQEK